jgi:predicted metal-dependent hydrolase
MTVNYRVEYSLRRRTIGIYVTREGVIIKAPPHVSLTYLDQVVQKKVDWIQKHSVPPLHHYLPGEQFLYLGKEYTLQLQDTISSIRLSGSFLQIPGYYEQADIRLQLENWYMEQAKQLIPDRITFYAPLLGVTPRRTLISRPKRRWGSCNSQGDIRINYRILMAPLTIIDYVVVHELAHLKEMNHSPHFWQVVGSVMPDYRQRRRELTRLRWFLE